MAKQEAKTLGLVEMVGRATEEDLAAIDQTIADKKSAMDATVKQLGDEIASLEALRKVLDIKLHGKQKKTWSRKKKESAAAPSASAATPNDSFAAQLASKVQLISRNGPMLTDTIARKLGETQAAVVGAITKHPSQFKSIGGGRIALPGFREPDDE
jgi:predicted PP-loop superfamily ATPase